jgi:hypothetical protein
MRSVVGDTLFRSETNCGADVAAVAAVAAYAPETATVAIPTTATAPT